MLRRMRSTQPSVFASGKSRRILSLSNMTPWRKLAERIQLAGQGETWININLLQEPSSVVVVDKEYLFAFWEWIFHTRKCHKKKPNYLQDKRQETTDLGLDIFTEDGYKLRCGQGATDGRFLIFPTFRLGSTSGPILSPGTLLELLA